MIPLREPTVQEKKAFGPTQTGDMTLERQADKIEFPHICRYGPALSIEPAMQLGRRTPNTAVGFRTRLDFFVDRPGGEIILSIRPSLYPSLPLPHTNRARIGRSRQFVKKSRRRLSIFLIHESTGPFWMNGSSKDSLNLAFNFLKRPLLCIVSFNSPNRIEARNRVFLHDVTRSFNPHSFVHSDTTLFGHGTGKSRPSEMENEAHTTDPRSPLRAWAEWGPHEMPVRGTCGDRRGRCRLDGTRCQQETMFRVLSAGPARISFPRNNTQGFH